MTVAIFPGSFDPVTNGHLDLIRRAAKIFDELVVAVGVNADKKAWLTAEQRVSLLVKALRTTAPSSRIQVVAFDGLLVDAAEKVGARVIVKGVRNETDLATEYAQACANQDLGDMETLLLPSSPKWQYVSSSLVRSIFSAGGSIVDYVPPAVNELLRQTKRPKSKRSHRLHAYWSD